MNKYIDADKLIAEIERRKYEVFPTNDGKVRACSTPDQLQYGWLNALTWVHRLIASLQQEQPEVDLEKEMQEEYYKYAIYESGSISGEGYQLEEQGHYECNLTRKEFKDIARHFYELGLNARKEGQK